MKTKWFSLAGAATAAALLTGCYTIPPGAEHGPNGTMAYEVLVDASAPGARLEVNGEVVGETPLRLKIFGDPDGTFHDFGSYFYGIRALPVVTNQFTQTRVFRTGHLFTPEDRIPREIHFDMNRPEPVYAPQGPPPAYGYPPPAYPYYYGPSYYWGPPVYFRGGIIVHHH